MSYLDIRQQLQFRVMTRKRYSWDLECEKVEETRRDSFFNALYQLRPYFYRMEEQEEFVRADSDHEHSSSDAENLYHDDVHTPDYFHVHMSDYPAEVSIKYVLLFQAIIQLYFLAVLLHFLCFCAAKPKLEKSLRALRCMKVKYCGIWLIFVILMLGLEVASFYVAHTISQYNKHWLSVLRANANGYACTSQALWINVNVLLARQEAS